MKKVLSLLLSGVILAASVPMNSLAADTTKAEVATAILKEPASNASEPTTSGLESVILAVKAKITVPKSYSEFNYNFNDTKSYSDAYWILTWSNPETNAYLQINCDKNNHIIYYSQYDRNEKGTGVAQYLKSELKAKADAFIGRVVPETKNDLEYTGADYDDIYSNNYVYHYVRKNNGITFPDNTVTVSVNSTTGEVASLAVNWLYNTTVPSSEVKITKQDAAALIRKNMKMKLVYRSDNLIIYDKVGNPENTKAFLVYEPTLDYISIDAKTGAVYLDKSKTVETNYGSKSKNEAAAQDSSTGSVSQSLTEDEIKKIEELKKLITKDKAINIITSNPYLYLEDTLTAYSATLSKVENRKGKTSYQWNVSLSDPRDVNYDKDKDTYRAYAYASVDASTGKIISFYSSMKGYYDETTQTYKSVKIKYNKQESRDILEKFLKTEMNSRFSNSALSEETNGYVAYYKNEQPVYGGYSYHYNRTNEGVEYPSNYINGSVDGVTGKIYSINTNWDDSVVFESTKGVMTADKAMDSYLGKEGYGLKYEINQINKVDSGKQSSDKKVSVSDTYSVEYEIRLVYRPDVTPNYISPFTGDQLNYNGEVYKETAPYTYKDITDTKENRGILLLADMNVGFEGDNFLPDKAITVGEINDLLKKIGYGSDYNAKKDAKADTPITRGELAKLFIDKLGLTKISKLKGIYATGFADEKSIGEDYLGAAALAKGLGIMTGDSKNNFNSDNKVTRFEAVGMIMNFITAQQNVLY